MQLIRAGVDSLYLAIKGTLPTTTLAQLADAKQLAAAQRYPVPYTFPGGVDVLVSANGATGGYAYTWDGGPLGGAWCCRQAADTSDWNLFAKPSATALLSLGFGRVLGDVFDHLPKIGGTMYEHSLNRVDYAMDFRDDRFELCLDNFVAHPRAKRAPHWEPQQSTSSSAVFTGRRLQSVTIGRMPGHQVIVYDKTAEARAKQNMHWFEAWGIDPGNLDARVWRIELRLGKKALAERRKIRTVGALTACYRETLLELLYQVRYTASGQPDRNVSRLEMHPCWRHSVNHIQEADLLAGLGEIAPTRMLGITQAMMQERYCQQMLGNAAGYGTALGYDDDAILSSLPRVVASAVEVAVKTESFNRSINRARQKQHLLFPSKDGL